MEEVGAECARADQVAQVLLRGRDQLRVDAIRRDRAEAADRLLLDRGQELSLEHERQRVDLVEEEAPAGGRLEQSRLRAARVREGARLEAEELRLEHGLGNGGAVDVDERAASPRAARVDQAGDEALARAGLTLDQDRRDVRAPGPVERREAPDLLPQGGERRGIADDRVGGMARHWSHVAATRGRAAISGRGRGPFVRE